VLLVGGSSRIPLIAQMVMAQIGRPAAVDARPKEAISLGAALVAFRAARQTAPVVAASPPPAPQPTAPVVAALQSPAHQPAPAPQPAPLPPPPPARTPTPASGSTAQPGSTPPSADSSRRWLVAALGVLIAVAAVTALILAQRDPGGAGDDDDDRAGQTQDSTTTTDDGPDTTTVTEPSGGGDGEATPPLPGTDWNDEARAEFVEAVAAEANIQAGAEFAGVDPEEIAGCVYDGLESSITFDQLQEAWTAEDVDPSHPAMVAMNSAAISCGISASG